MSKISGSGELYDDIDEAMAPYHESEDTEMWRQYRKEIDPIIKEVKDRTMMKPEINVFANFVLFELWKEKRKLEEENDRPTLKRVAERILQLSDLNNIFSSDEMQDNIEDIHQIVSNL